MKRINRQALLLAFIGLLSFGGLVSEVTPAAAGSNYGVVMNMYGSTVQIDCNYGQGPYHYIYESRGGSVRKGTHSNSATYCSDTDRWRSLRDDRCYRVAIAGTIQAWQRAEAGQWIKNPGLSRTYVSSTTRERC